MPTVALKLDDIGIGIGKGIGIWMTNPNLWRNFAISRQTMREIGIIPIRRIMYVKYFFNPFDRYELTDKQMDRFEIIVNITASVVIRD